MPCHSVHFSSDDFCATPRRTYRQYHSRRISKRGRPCLAKQRSRPREFPYPRDLDAEDGVMPSGCGSSTPKTRCVSAICRRTVLALRTAELFSQPMLARRLGMSINEFSRKELVRNVPSDVMLVKIDLELDGTSTETSPRGLCTLRVPFSHSPFDGRVFGHSHLQSPSRAQVLGNALVWESG